MMSTFENPIDYDEDLTYSDGGHNWRSIIFSLLVIGGVIAGIVTAIYLLGYVDELLYWSGRRLTLEECLHGDLTPHRLPPTWISHDKFVYQADDGSLALLDTSNNSISLLVSNHTLLYVCVRKSQRGVAVERVKNHGLGVVELKCRREAEAACRAAFQVKLDEFFVELYTAMFLPVRSNAFCPRVRDRETNDATHETTTAALRGGESF